MKILARPLRQAPAAAAPCPAGRPGRFELTTNQRRCVTAGTQLSRQGCDMTPQTHDQDITSWLQLLSAIEDAEAGHGTVRLTEICMSVYGALAAAQFQITQLRARIHVLAAAGPAHAVVR